MTDEIYRCGEVDRSEPWGGHNYPCGHYAEVVRFSTDHGTACARDAWKAMAEAQARLLAAYRTVDQRKGAAAADAVGQARDRLRELGEDVGKV